MHPTTRSSEPPAKRPASGAGTWQPLHGLPVLQGIHRDTLHLLHGLSLIQLQRTEPVTHPLGHPTDQYLLFSDGGSRVNPGPGGAGAVVVRVDAHGGNPRVVWVASMSLAHRTTTNNQAEYFGLVTGLRIASRLRLRPITVIGDSAMIIVIIAQLQNHKAPKHPRLRRLYGQVRVLADVLVVKEWRHHVRAYNTMVEHAANVAMDSRRSIQTPDPTTHVAWAALQIHLHDDVSRWQASTLQFQSKNLATTVVGIEVDHHLPVNLGPVCRHTDQDPVRQVSDYSDNGVHLALLPENSCGDNALRYSGFQISTSAFQLHDEQGREPLPISAKHHRIGEATDMPATQHLHTVLRSSQFATEGAGETDRDQGGTQRQHPDENDRWVHEPTYAGGSRQKTTEATAATANATASGHSSMTPAPPEETQQKTTSATDTVKTTSSGDSSATTAQENTRTTTRNPTKTQQRTTSATGSVKTTSSGGTLVPRALPSGIGTGDAGTMTMHTYRNASLASGLGFVALTIIIVGILNALTLGSETALTFKVVFDRGRSRSLLHRPAARRVACEQLRMKGRSSQRKEQRMQWEPGRHMTR